MATPNTRPHVGEPTKPTLLALHGSGSSSLIHTVQLARLSRLLKPHFDIVSLEAPFPSAAGPGILPIFEGCGPFKRWIPPQEKVSIDGMKRGEASPVMHAQVENIIKDAISKVKSQGGKVAGLIGFSQGTRVVAGLLKGTEIARKLREGGAKGVEELDWVDFGFALSVCGSYPPPTIPPSVISVLSSSALSEEEQKALETSKIQIPTMHIQGQQDDWAWAGKLLIDGVYEGAEDKSIVLDLDIGHHYPVDADVNERIRDWILDAWKRSGEVEKR